MINGTSSIPRVIIIFDIVIDIVTERGGGAMKEMTLFISTEVLRNKRSERLTTNNFRTANTHVYLRRRPLPQRFVNTTLFCTNYNAEIYRYIECGNCLLRSSLVSRLDSLVKGLG